MTKIEKAILAELQLLFHKPACLVDEAFSDECATHTVTHHMALLPHYRLGVYDGNYDGQNDWLYRKPNEFRYAKYFQEDQEDDDVDNG